MNSKQTEKNIFLDYIKYLHPLRYKIDFRKDENIILNKLKEFDTTALILNKRFLLRDALRFQKKEIIKFLNKL